MSRRLANCFCLLEGRVGVILLRSVSLAFAFVVAASSLAQTLNGLSVPSQIRSGLQGTGTVSILSPAGTNGVSVGLSSSSPVAVVPANATIPAGATNGTFQVTGNNPGYTRVPATITASLALLERQVSTTILPGNYSSFVSQTVPTTMVIGQSYPVTLQFKNTGTTTWDATHFYKLQSVNPVDNLTWGTKRLRLQNAPVAPGQTGTFFGTVVAPSTIGQFNFQWRCVQDDIYDPFGAVSTNVVVTTNGGIDAAQFLGQTNVPTTIIARSQFMPTISFKNTGTSTWTTAAGYNLKSRNPYLNTYWGTSTIALPSSVAPGASVVFTPTLTVPFTPGTYTFAWFMTHNSGFGDIPASVNVAVTPYYNSYFVSQTVPSTVNVGSTFDASFTFKNTGGATWTTAGQFWLISQPGLNTTWTINRIQLPSGAWVATNASVTFSGLLTAPVTPGTYLMQWQVSRNDAPLGQTSKSIQIHVTSPEDALCTGQTIPINATAGRHYIAQVTFENVGTADWPLNTAVGVYPAFDGTWALQSLATGSVITVGNSRTYTLDLVAPYIAGNYQLQFCMRDLDKNSWFGQPSPPVSVSAGASQYAQSPWPASRGGRTRTTARGYGSGATGTVLWSHQLGDGFFVFFETEPAIGPDGTVYVGTLNTTPGSSIFYALDGSTGTIKWSYNLGEYAASPPSIAADGTVYVGTNGYINQGIPSTFYAFDGQTGAVKWSQTVTGLYTPAASAIGPDGTVYVPTLGHVYAFDGQTGAVKWHTSIADNFDGCPAFADDGTLYLAASDQLNAFDSSTGALKWSVTAPDSGPISSTPSVGVDGTIYVLTQWGDLFAVDPNTHAIKWSIVAAGRFCVGSLALSADGTIYFGSEDKKVYAINASTGTVKWTYTTGGEIDCSASIGSDGTVYIGSADGFLYALDGATGTKKFSTLVGNTVYSGLAIGADGTIYVPTTTGFIRAIR